MTTHFGLSGSNTRWYVPDGVNNFINVDAGCGLKNGYVVVVSAPGYIYAQHRSAYEVRKNLTYTAKRNGANALLNVYVESGATQFHAYGQMAIVAKPSSTGQSRDDVLEWAHRRYLGWIPHQPSQQPPRNNSSTRSDSQQIPLLKDVSFWTLFAKVIFWTTLALFLLTCIAD